MTMDPRHPPLKGRLHMAQEAVAEEVGQIREAMGTRKEPGKVRVLPQHAHQILTPSPSIMR